MKARKRIILVLLGVTVAAITAGVPVVQFGRIAKDPGVTEKKKCYSESEVLILMEMTNAPRDRAIELLDLACEYAVKP